MPRLYEYMGLKIFFYSSEHEPIHVHAKYGNTESKIEIIVEEGVVSELRYRSVKTRRPLNPKNKAKFIRLVTVLSDEIIQSWINHFVLKKKVVNIKISGKL